MLAPEVPEVIRRGDRVATPQGPGLLERFFVCRWYSGDVDTWAVVSLDSGALAVVEAESVTHEHPIPSCSVCGGPADVVVQRDGDGSVRSALCEHCAADALGGRQ